MIVLWKCATDNRWTAWKRVEENIFKPAYRPYQINNEWQFTFMGSLDTASIADTMGTRSEDHMVMIVWSLNRNTPIHWLLVLVLPS